MPKRQLVKTVLQILLEKVASDATRAVSGKGRLSAAPLVAEFFFHKYGLKALMDWHITYPRCR